MTSMKDVAEAAGVSTATVSRALADKPYVNEEIRQRIQAVAKKLNYRPNRVAQSLRVQKTSTIGLVVSDIQNSFFTQVCRSVEDAALAAGYSVFICNTDESRAKEEMYLQLMQEQNVAGLIVSPTGDDSKELQVLNDRNIPMVIIDRRVSRMEADTVLLNNIDAAEQLTSHLLDHGCKRLTGIFGMSSATGLERLQGFKQAFEKKHLPPPAAEQIIMARADIASGFEVTQELLQQRPRPDALFVSSALLATGAFQALRAHSISVPGEMAFVAFDETNWTGMVLPGITVVEQPTHDIGQIAAELLLKRIEQPDRSCCEVVLKGKLIIRGSCGCTELP